MKNFYSLIILILIILPLNLFPQSWNKVNSIPAPYSNNYWLDVYFLNNSYGWVCGFNGMVIRTTDGGQTWAGSFVPFANQLESVDFPSTNIGYTSGMDGIFKSTNGGASWFDITPQGAIQVWGNFFVDDDYGVVIGEGCNGYQKFWLTTNGGLNWSLYLDSVPNSGLADVILYGRNSLGYASSSGKIWKTTDGGATWQLHSTSGPNYWQEEITNIGNSFLVPFAGLNCNGDGSNGGMHFSTDDGGTWNNYSTGYPMFGAFLLDQRTGWACGYNREVEYTSDGGLTWIKRNCGIENVNLDDIWFNSPSEGWVVGEGGVYFLGPDRQEVSRLNMVYGNVCIPDFKYDTLWVKNHSFNNSVSVTTNLYGVNFEDFSIILPPGNFALSACDSQMIIVRFKPLTAGNNKNAKLDIKIINGQTFTIDLLGDANEMTVVPKDTLLVINPAYCGMITIDSLQWTASSPDNSIITIQKLTGNFEINSESTLPINVYTTGIYTGFSASPSDTGWVESRFKFTMLPCLKDTIITVRAYGVSPIIWSDDRISFNLNCELSRLDTIPVFNTGNSDLIISDYNFNSSNTAFSFIGWISGRQFPITIKPSESDSIILKYEPADQGTHSAILSLTNNDSTSIRGRKNPYIINLSGVITSTDVIPKESLFIENDICLGDSIVLNLPIKNKGVLTAILQNPVFKNKNYRILIPGKNFPLQMKENDSVNCVIIFKPDSAGQYLDTIYINSLPCNEMLKIIISVKCVDSYITVNPKTVNDVIQTGLPLTKKFMVNAYGNIPMKISQISLNPPRSDWSMNISPSLPFNINAGDSVEFTIDFTSLSDTVLNSKLVFNLESYCPMNDTVALNILSHSVWLKTSSDSLSFGYRKCTAGMIFDTLTISNLGSIPDTLLSIEIQPTGLPFTIINLPAFPHIMSPGGVENYIVGFDAAQEGLFDGTLVIASKNLRNLSLKLKLSGEYRTVNTKPDAVSLDYGNVEPCQDTIIKSFYMKNTGTLADNLTISKTSNLSGYDIIPQNNLVVNPNDSVLVSVILIPSEFRNTGNYNEQFILSSTICTNIHTVDANVNIIKPRLTIDPPNLTFTDIWIDDSLVKYIDIKNETQYSKKINSLAIVPPSSQFRFEAVFPVTLPPNGSIRIPITFTARNTGTEQTGFEVIEESVCIDTSIVNLIANVPAEIYNTSVKIGNYKAEPGDTITLEIELLNEISRVKPDSLNFSIAFDKRLFYPLKAYAKFRNSRQRINFDYLADTISGSVQKQYAELLFQEPGNIIFIEGEILKFYPDSTGLYITDFKPVTSKVVNINRIDGSLKVENICPLTGGLVLKLTNSTNTSIDDPVINSDNMVVEIQNSEEQTFAVEIWNMLGNIVHNEQIKINKETKSFSLNVSDLMNGAYILTINSDKYYSGRYRFIIIR